MVISVLPYQLPTLCPSSRLAQVLVDHPGYRIQHIIEDGASSDLEVGIYLHAGAQREPVGQVAEPGFTQFDARAIVDRAAAEKDQCGTI